MRQNSIRKPMFVWLLGAHTLTLHDIDIRYIMKLLGAFLTCPLIVSSRRARTYAISVCDTSLSENPGYEMVVGSHAAASNW